mmetsp:Transcript_17848/g.42072  ORF Transcript_17848/g.42072 Transcript_17848/m.42072 type:complete len:224 (+) Transcript_17848:105-776(+)
MIAFWLNATLHRPPNSSLKTTAIKNETVLRLKQRLSTLTGVPPWAQQLFKANLIQSLDDPACEIFEKQVTENTALQDICDGELDSGSSKQVYLLLQDSRVPCDHTSSVIVTVPSGRNPVSRMEIPASTSFGEVLNAIKTQQQYDFVLLKTTNVSENHGLLDANALLSSSPCNRPGIAILLDVRDGINWERERVLWLGTKQPECVFQLLNRDIVRHIVDVINYA